MSSEPLKIYGSPRTLRAALMRRIRTAEDDLLGHLEAARDEFKGVPRLDPADHGLARFVQQAEYSRELDKVEQSVFRWADGNRQLLRKHLGPVVAEEIVPAAVRPRWSPEQDDAYLRADLCEAQVTRWLAGMRAVLDRLPDPGPATVREPDDRFSELRQAGLIESSLLSSYVARMAKTSTRPQISAAIGAAKELVEACNRATLDRLGTPYKEDDFGKIGKEVRIAISSREGAAPSTRAGNAIGQVFSGMATVELALATLRNELGTGHGRASLPKGLRPRHAQLAIDIADTHIRYLVGTLADLKLL